MTIPYRGVTTQSTYFVTANTFQKKNLFQADRNARLFLDVLSHYREEKKYLIHEFVLMPDHFHLIITPTGITLERSKQLIKGGCSFRMGKEFGRRRDVWQPSFHDRRIRDAAEYEKFRDYIHNNPVKRFLVTRPEDYPYSSAAGSFPLDPVPQWLKPLKKATSTQA
jgi:putative transposase